MHHITPERIAALADEPATLPERTHLSACTECTAELVAAQRLMRMAMTDTPAIERPVTSWEKLGPALMSEGLIRTPIDGAASGRVMAMRRPPRVRWAMQAAAGVFLAVGGAIVGRASVALPDEQSAGTTTVATTDTGFTSTVDAMNVLQHASDQYQRAIAYLADNDSSVSVRGRDAAELYQTRLEVLDQAVASSRAALYRAPRDPVLNNYYLQTVGARDLTLRQIGQALPVSSTRRTRF
jgi:hypothetical protein